MLDPKLENDLMQEISKDLATSHVTLGPWMKELIKSKISLVITRVYQEGMREAFLAMARGLKKNG